MCAPPTRATKRSATAPTMRSASPAADLRCKVIGEGANLGMTQRGRIEAALARRAAQHRRDRQFRRRQHLRRRGQYQDRARARRCATAGSRWTRRNALLAAMTDEVAELVLRNNYLQTLALSLAAAARPGGSRLPAAADADARSARPPRPRGRIPARRCGARRAPRGARKPSPGRNLRCCSPMPSSRSTTICSQSACPTIHISPASSSAISPSEIAAQFPDALEHHRLRREIIATQLANSMINRGGPSFVVRIADQTGAAPAAIAAAFAAVRDSYGMTALNGEIDALDNGFPASCSSTSTRRCRICCSTASSGSCATSI